MGDFLTVAGNTRWRQIGCWIIAALLLTVVAGAQEAHDEVIERLAKVEYFAFGGIGYAGVRSEGEKDYRLILSRASAKTDFERLYSQGNPQAKTYALVGIHKLDPKRFAELLTTLGVSKEKIATERGCIASNELLKEIVKEIKRSQYDLD
jgi:hypothetical protein